MWRAPSQASLRCTIRNVCSHRAKVDALQLNPRAVRWRPANPESMLAPARRLLQSAFGLPCWQVRWDSQVGLDLNLGAPRMELVEPRARPNAPPRVRTLLASRRVRLLGTHWLWVAPEAWRILLADGTEARRSASARRCDIATARLSGERLVGLQIAPRRGGTIFFFDLGGRIIVRPPNGWGQPEDGELWSLWGPRQRYVAVWASGRYGLGDVRREDPPLQPLATDDGASPLALGRQGGRWRGAI